MSAAQTRENCCCLLPPQSEQPHKAEQPHNMELVEPPWLSLFVWFFALELTLWNLLIVLADLVNSMDKDKLNNSMQIELFYLIENLNSWKLMNKESLRYW